MFLNSVIFNAAMIKYLCETCLYYLRTVEIHDLTEALKSLCCDYAYVLQLHQHLFSRSTKGQGIRIGWALNVSGKKIGNKDQELGVKRGNAASLGENTV